MVSMVHAIIPLAHSSPTSMAGAQPNPMTDAVLFRIKVQRDACLLTVLHPGPQFSREC